MTKNENNMKNIISATKRIARNLLTLVEKKHNYFLKIIARKSDSLAAFNTFK